ncbi:hypothetical protein PRUPE_2G228600 [Prunus persica]|uniref:DUF674 domain-containing protein n=1 Tax=Prunus persica TaxID=3760 RepID=A0A251QK26_PRUPE|nr:uncharacterized protein LOC18786513 [Prunus persica]ONI24176.1 hypothetical protein PRUPE_2G228600 [Prunus persica]
MATNTVSLKLLIDTKGHKVLFAEAGKDFVDFLFTPLALPVGTVIRLLSKDNMVGSLGKLYDSLELLNDTYMLPNLNKDTLAKKVYMCRTYHLFIADDPRAICPACKYTLSTEVPYVAAPAIAEGSSGGGGGGGYVKDVVTYMIMDNLEVKPMSTISCIAMLNRFNVKEVGTLEERMVLLGMDEGLKLLKASLESNAVLTNVFFGKKEV